MPSVGILAEEECDHPNVGTAISSNTSSTKRFILWRSLVLGSIHDDGEVVLWQTRVWRQQAAGLFELMVLNAANELASCRNWAMIAGHSGSTQWMAARECASANSPAPASAWPTKPLTHCSRKHADTNMPQERTRPAVRALLLASSKISPMSLLT